MSSLFQSQVNATVTKSRVSLPIEARLGRLAPALGRATAETAGAFFCTQATVGTAWKAPRINDSRSFHCSQKNMGEKFEMICNLTVDKTEWDKLFAGDVSDQIKMDAYCEMANCICGSLIADSGFMDEFGYMIPCVPCSGPGLPSPAARPYRGAIQLAGTWIHFSVLVQEAQATCVSTDQLKAVA